MFNCVLHSHIYTRVITACTFLCIVKSNFARAHLKIGRIFVDTQDGSARRLAAAVRKIRKLLMKNSLCRNVNEMGKKMFSTCMYYVLLYDQTKCIVLAHTHTHKKYDKFAKARYQYMQNCWSKLMTSKDAEKLFLFCHHIRFPAKHARI